MKNKKYIVSLIFVLLFFVGSHSFLFGQNLKITNERIKSLSKRFDDFISKTNPSQDKKDRAEAIREELRKIKNRADQLTEAESKTDDGKANLNAINAELTNLDNKFTRPNPSPAIVREDGQNPPAQIPTSGEVDKNLQEPRGKVQSIQQDSENIQSKSFDWWEWALIGLAGLLVIGGIGAAGFFLRRGKQRERADIDLNFNKLARKQAEFSQKIEALNKVSTDLSQQVAQQKAEISRLKQTSISAASSYAAAPPPSMSSYQPPREEPQFPVEVESYLEKVGRAATPVKYDYKEGMLVPDATQEGGLIIVQADGLLYLVPSFGFFQTKSDYTNYYERYYACARPMGGSVWIRQPATVNQVGGGWQLAQQGELEVR